MHLTPVGFRNKGSDFVLESVVCWQNWVIDQGKSGLAQLGLKSSLPTTEVLLLKRINAIDFLGSHVTQV